jgi:multidrug resistance efflux pump
MMWLRKMRTVLIVLGLALAIGSGTALLVGARGVTNGSGDASAKPGDTQPRSASGLWVLGTVDTDPPPVKYGLTAVLQSGTISKVHVKDGDEVKAGQPLYEFDSTFQNADLKLAEMGVGVFQAKVNEARELAKQHEKLIEVSEAGVEAAKVKESQCARYYHLVEANLERYYKTEMYPPDSWKERKESDPTLYKANLDYATAMSERKLKEADLNRLKAVNPQVKVLEAEAAVKQAEAGQAKAQAAVELCVMRAKTTGTVEQVTIGPGTTLGIGTPAPALWLIPAGPRVVRAEVEAEFAHRIGPTIQGKTVTITDHTDTKLTYSGTVRRAPTMFLPKRSNPDSFLGSDTRILEVVVEVTDPNPPGKPPLHVGQRVRVNLGQ